MSFLATPPPELILYPVGIEGNNVLDFLDYHGLSNRLICLATEAVSDTPPQRFVRSYPLLPLNYMPHFRDLGVIIVAAPQVYHERLHQMLTDFGFKEIIYINADTFKQIDEVLRQFVSSGRVLMWTMERLMRRVNRLERTLMDQADIISVHEASFASFRGRFRRQELVIVGGGPSAKNYKPIPGAIHIGINFAWMREDISFDYLFTQDRFHNELSGIKTEDGFDRIKDKIFIGKVVDSYPRTSIPEYVSHRWNNVLRYYLDECPRPFDQILYQDICHHQFVCWGSTSFAVFQFALFTAPKKLYLVGLDTASAGQHFYNHPDARYDASGKNMQTGVLKLGYAKMKMFADEYYPDTEIVSINPVGLKGLFTDVYTDASSSADVPRAIDKEVD